jgi:putative ABC transport system substrate-binding protein
MDRRSLIMTFATMLAAPLAAKAQQAEKVYRVGFLSLGAPPSRSGLWQGFIEAMREMKYEEGRNLIAIPALAEGRRERLPGLVANLVRERADVILTTSTNETLAAKRATSPIPVVMTLVPDPVGQRLVASLARPGGNVTGLKNLVPGLSAKYVELLREVIPSASRLAVVGGPGAPHISWTGS